jgi:hypothetical protein
MPGVSITNTENKDRTEFQYDEQGHKNEIRTFDPKTLERTQRAAFVGSPWDGATAGFGVPSGGRLITIYDENDRPVEMQIRDAEDHLVSRVVRSYNADGLVIEDKSILENPASVLDKLPAEERSQLNPAQAQTMTALLQAENTSSFFTYDAQGRVTKKQESGGTMQSTTTTIYNDHGDIAEEHTIVISSLAMGVSYSIAENGMPMPEKSTTSPESYVLTDSDVHYRYLYDAYGNWTEQSANDSRHPDAAPNVRRRILTYY